MAQWQVTCSWEHHGTPPKPPRDMAVARHVQERYKQCNTTRNPESMYWKSESVCFVMNLLKQNEFRMAGYCEKCFLQGCYDWGRRSDGGIAKGLCRNVAPRSQSQYEERLAVLKNDYHALRNMKCVGQVYYKEGEEVPPNAPEKFTPFFSNWVKLLAPVPS